MDEKLRKLRSLGTVVKPSILIGKNGLTDQTIKNIRNELKKNDVVKIRILNKFIEDKDKKAVVDLLLEKTNSTLVQFIGFTVVLTRK